MYDLTQSHDFLLDFCRDRFFSGLTSREDKNPVWSLAATYLSSRPLDIALRTCISDSSRGCRMIGPRQHLIDNY